jgi:SAM-dependent methyltransferase
MMNSNQFHGHYQGGIEAGRLAAGRGLIELHRTQAIVKRYLSEASCVVYDIGGGPGVYAVWLLGLGHAVHLVDPVPLHVEQAREAMADVATGDWSATIGDARSLSLPDESADVVLLLGPLYHLTERADRITALSEAHRVLRPGGFIFAGAISRFASLLDGMAGGHLDDPDFLPIVERDLRDGQHRNPTGNPRYFTTAFFHRPEELRTELDDAGFDVETICGIEGPTWILPDVAERWEDDTRRDIWTRLLERIEGEVALLGVSAHLLAIGRRS